MYIPNEDVRTMMLVLGIGIGAILMYILTWFVNEVSRITELRHKYQMSLKDEDLKKYLEHRNEVTK